MKALKIDSVAKTVTEIEVAGLKDMQDVVGGYIERATALPNGDEVYVDDEGLLKEPQHFFSITGTHTPFAGNGLVIGAADENGDNKADVKSSVASLTETVIFMNLTDVLAWLHSHKA